MAGVLFMGTGQLLEAPCPESLKVSVSDCGSMSRTAGGRLVRSTPRAPVRTVKAVWKDLSGEDAARILSVLSQASFTLKYPDPVEGQLRQAEFVCTLREAELARADESGGRYRSLVCSMTEV